MNNDKPSSESSHSPTEQPGDSKWKIEYSKYSTYCNIIDADGYVGTIQGREKAELIARAPALLSEVATLRDKQAELIAERDREKADAEKWYKKYNEMSKMAFNSANKASDLLAENERLKKFMESNHNEALSVLLSKRTAENARLREALDVTMSIIVGSPTPEEVKMAYDYLYDIRYGTTTPKP